MTQLRKQMLTFLAEEGVTVEAERCRKHHVLKCRTPGDNQIMVTFAKSPSDHRAFQNMVSNVRRSIKEVDKSHG